MGNDEKCLWVKTVEYINDMVDGEYFKPIELKRSVYGERKINSTVGSYIIFLLKANYLERISKGKYIRIKIIPLTLSTTKVYNYLYNNPLKDRYDKIEEIKNRIDK